MNEDSDYLVITSILHDVACKNSKSKIHLCFERSQVTPEVLESI